MQTDRKREREIFYPLVHFPICCNFQDLIRSKPGAWTPICGPQVGGRGPGSWSILHGLPGTSAGIWIGSRAAAAWTSTPIRDATVTSRGLPHVTTMSAPWLFSESEAGTWWSLRKPDQNLLKFLLALLASWLTWGPLFHHPDMFYSDSEHMDSSQERGLGRFPCM